MHEKYPQQKFSSIINNRLFSLRALFTVALTRLLISNNILCKQAVCTVRANIGHTKWRNARLRNYYIRSAIHGHAISKLSDRQRKGNLKMCENSMHNSFRKFNQTKLKVNGKSWWIIDIQLMAIDIRHSHIFPTWRINVLDKCAHWN